MDNHNEIMRALGRIEGELVEIRKLSERVSRLEQWQSWLPALEAYTAWLSNPASQKRSNNICYGLFS